MQINYLRLFLSRPILGEPLRVGLSNPASTRPAAANPARVGLFAPSLLCPIKKGANQLRFAPKEAEKTNPNLVQECCEFCRFGQQIRARN